ncbi:hypothetical protein [Geobacter sp.]|uniref:hypothetical protein n=1 Tax=Geobacter sp. TaxID=46610 RepID=UPI001ACC1C64|nr:hypothetical protein [Geobacter sp.]CAG0966715.1 hypothetical protein GEOBC_01038 [Geobacteraceae bacterium]
MNKTLKTFSLALALVTATCGVALATPSTQIWIPSTDVQAFGTVHLGVDNYIRVSENADGEKAPNTYDLGVTVGVLPFEKLQLEVGVDYMVTGTEPGDSHPFYFNAKLGTPEGSLFSNSPAMAVGIYNAGTKENVTDQDITYALVAKTLPVIGRLSAGYYLGNSAVLNDTNGNNENHGVLLSWDRTMSEISDKLWAAVDYQGGNNGVGALSFGVCWAFSKNVSLIVGYDIYNESALGGKNTFTTQLDINIP